MAVDPVERSIRFLKARFAARKLSEEPENRGKRAPQDSGEGEIIGS